MLAFAVQITTIERTTPMDKIKQRLGYRPKFTTSEGLERAVRWRLEGVQAGREGQSGLRCTAFERRNLAVQLLVPDGSRSPWVRVCWEGARGSIVCVSI